MRAFRNLGTSIRLDASVNGCERSSGLEYASMKKRHRLFLVGLSTCQIVVLTAAIVGVARGASDDPRLSFVGKRRNLALGASYQYSRVPDYRLTTNEGDLTELTDGRLSERKGERIWFDRHAVAWSGEEDSAGSDVVRHFGQRESASCGPHKSLRWATGFVVPPGRGIDEVPHCCRPACRRHCARR